MSLTRRSFAAASLALAATPAFAHTSKARPIVIAHRGASGERPEHTAMAYRLAVDQGADFIEPDLVITKDDRLVVRHENEIGGTTDIADKPEFAARRTTRVIDGESLTGWFTEDFTLAELKTLRCRERLPKLRPANARYDGREAIPTFEEVVALARSESARVGRVIGVYPEMKHPQHFASIGLPFEQRMADALKAADLDSGDAPVFVQCFEVGPLKAIRALTKARLVQLVDAEGGPADLPGMRYADMVTAEGLKGVAVYADGVGPNWSLVVPTDGDKLLPATALVADAHATGLAVHPWTVRAENYFLPRALQRGAAGRPDRPRLHGDARAVFKALYAAGVDGVFSDFPELAAAARSE